MAENISNVHDIFHPSPVSLKELAAIAVSLEVWRREMNECRQKDGTMASFFPDDHRISLKSRLPDLPSVILKMIKKYLTLFGYSMERWLDDHHKRVHFWYKHQNTVLSYFDDFVCDQFGKIDYVRTAKRMIRCDQFSVDEKFCIACAYFFEDDIERLWQSGSSHMGTNVRKLRILAYGGRWKAYLINFHEHAHLYYWICSLTHQLDKIPTQENNTIEDEMFDRRIPRVGPSMTYFWDRLPIENRMRKAISVANSCTESAVRFILPKLDNQQLSQFVDEEGDNLMHNLWENVADYGENLLLATWSCIGNIMNESNFTNLVVKMLVADYEYEDVDARVYGNYLFREIWNNARSDLKQSVMRNISPEMLEHLGFRSHECSLDFDIEFLSIIAEYTSSEDRIAFLRDCCHLLIAIIPLEGLQRFMKSCFENEDELIQFKQTVMIENDLVLDYCISLLLRSSFEKVNKFVIFCYPNLQAARIFKQRLLQLAFPSVYVDYDELEFFTLVVLPNIVKKPKEFNQFIDEAYNDVDLSTDFKNQLISLSYSQLRLSKFAWLGRISLERLIEFIDTFVPTDQVLRIKLHMDDVLRNS
ncbi:unnamed protein product [Allacma fusca]|uniref:Uncharacterized protein n=1 Tax=Allacma fusca TaxID=39272 RepID=A0A8J2JB01_9HEXA|nr:unnamed protein product [Allacma fusca]